MENAIDCFYSEQTFTEIWQFTSVWILQEETSHKSCEDWIKLILSIDK